MSSSEDKPMNIRDFRYVYVRRRRNTTGSGRVVRDLDLNLPPPSEPSMRKTDGSPEIGDDSPLSPALNNLFQRAAFIPRRKRSTINRKPRWDQQATLSPPPSSDHHQASSAAVSAPKKKWRCPTCLRRIDEDELSKPIIYLKQLKLKNDINKSEG